MTRRRQSGVVERRTTEWGWLNLRSEIKSLGVSKGKEKSTYEVELVTNALVEVDARDPKLRCVKQIVESPDG